MDTLVRTHRIPGGEPRVSHGVWVTATSQCSFISPDRGLALPGMRTVGEATPVWGRGPRGKPSAPPPLILLKGLKWLKDFSDISNNAPSLKVKVFVKDTKAGACFRSCRPAFL